MFCFLFVIKQKACQILKIDIFDIILIGYLQQQNLTLPNIMNNIYQFLWNSFHNLKDFSHFGVVKILKNKAGSDHFNKQH